MTISNVYNSWLSLIFITSDIFKPFIKGNNFAVWERDKFDFGHHFAFLTIFLNWANMKSQKPKFGRNTARTGYPKGFKIFAQVATLTHILVMTGMTIWVLRLSQRFDPILCPCLVVIVKILTRYMSIVNSLNQNLVKTQGFDLNVTSDVACSLMFYLLPQYNLNIKNTKNKILCQYLDIVIFAKIRPNLELGGGGGGRFFHQMIRHSRYV